MGHASPQHETHTLDSILSPPPLLCHHALEGKTGLTNNVCVIIVPRIR